MSFEKFGLSPELLNGLADVRLEKPTPLQEKMLPIVLEGKHVLVETHSNDDLAFLIPALQKITENGEVTGTQVLILTPSIERAENIDEQVWALGYHAQISSALMAMKGDKATQEQALLDGAPVIVANPGRYIEILDKQNFRLKDLKLIVIDEAHEMQQFNLVNRVKDILRFVDCEPQIVILSSEQNSATKQLVDIALKNPELIGFESNGEPETASEDAGVAPAEHFELDQDHVENKLESASVSVVLKKDLPITNGSETNDSITPKTPVNSSDQGYIKVPPRMKISTLMGYLEQSGSKHVAVFSASSRTSDRLFKIIRKKNWGVVSLGDDLDESMYAERLERYKKYEMRVLLIGGLSIDKVDCSEMDEIINYDVPSDTSEYQKRAELVSGNTVSKMISLVSKMDAEVMETISEEMGFSPSEIQISEKLTEQKPKFGIEKKQNRAPRRKSSGNSSKPKNNRGPIKVKKKEKPKSLPRPTYEGLTGGRDGNASETGIFGWVKKLFK